MINILSTGEYLPSLFMVAGSNKVTEYYIITQVSLRKNKISFFPMSIHKLHTGNDFHHHGCYHVFHHWPSLCQSSSFQEFFKRQSLFYAIYAILWLTCSQYHLML